MSDKYGLYHKFNIVQLDPNEREGVLWTIASNGVVVNVTRNDGRSREGEKHYGCEYKVLAIEGYGGEDFALDVALEAYAEACKATHPQLAADILDGMTYQYDWFVLDITHDPYAGAALNAFYANGGRFPKEPID